MSKKDGYEQRAENGMKSGFVGFFTNLLLVIIKLIAGITAGSVSILADAINNLGDTASALLTIAGFYIASKPADEQHPYGHQRAEYISGLIVSFFILVVGFQFLMSSIEKILNPTSVQSSRLVFILLFVSILVKIVLGLYYRFLNNKMTSRSTLLRALVKDSINDSLMTFVIVVSYFIEIQFDWYIDGYVGAGVALFILYTGVTSIIDASNDLLGTRPSKDLVKQMQGVLDSYDSIIGYHDLMVHKYGPNNFFVTVDIEVDSRWSLIKAHRVLDEIEREFEENFNSTTVCHLDPIVLNDEVQNNIYALVKKTLKSHDSDFHFHDFRVIDEEDKKEIYFDVVIPSKIKSSDESLYTFLSDEVKKDFPDFELMIYFDRHYILDE